LCCCLPLPTSPPLVNPAGYCLADLQECVAHLLHLHQCATASASSEALAPFNFINEKYSQDCWLQASLQQVPPAGCMAGSLQQGQQQAPAAAAQPGSGMLLQSS
jgi:hypothetical protein